MAPQKDHLSDCNQHNVPVQDFEQAFCIRCSQPECSRSQYGGSKFDRRVNTWEDRLFKDVPKLSKDDPRYLPIVGADFKTIDPARRTVAFSSPSWFDPRDIPSTKEEAPPPPPPSPPLVAEEAPVAKVREETPSPSEPAQAKNLPRSLLLLNTPMDTKVLPGGPTSLPTGDKWSGPVPNSEPLSPAPIVKKGATIKFGGSSGVE